MQCTSCEQLWPRRAVNPCFRGNGAGGDDRDEMSKYGTLSKALVRGAVVGSQKAVKRCMVATGSRGVVEPDRFSGGGLFVGC